MYRTASILCHHLYKKKKRHVLLYMLVNAYPFSVKIPKDSEVAASARGHWMAGTGREGDLLFTVCPSSLFEFGTMIMYYLVKTFSN